MVVDLERLIEPLALWMQCILAERQLDEEEPPQPQDAVLVYQGNGMTQVVTWGQLEALVNGAYALVDAGE